jgi:hypothetical protein
MSWTSPGHGYKMMMETTYLHEEVIEYEIEKLNNTIDGRAEIDKWNSIGKKMGVKVVIQNFPRKGGNPVVVTMTGNKQKLKDMDKLAKDESLIASNDWSVVKHFDDKALKYYKQRSLSGKALKKREVYFQSRDK